MADKDFKHIIRIANADIRGEEPLFKALTRIKGVGYMMSNAICFTTQIDRNKQTGTLSDAEIKKIADQIEFMKGVPKFMFNRRKDYETGTDKHIVTTNLQFEQDNDIKRMKKIRSFKGVRHTQGQPVRGQRTKAHFRRGGKAVGVMRNAIAAPKPAAAPEKESKEKKK